MSRVFISYAHEDETVAQRLYHDLKKVGLSPWLDSLDLIGGENWQEVIEETIQKSSHVVILISRNSVGKQGYFQDEVLQIYEMSRQIPPGQIFVIPVRLDDSEPRHKFLKKLHWVHLFPSYEDGRDKLWRSIKNSSDTEVTGLLAELPFLSEVLERAESPFRFGVFAPAGLRRESVVLRTESSFLNSPRIATAVIDLARCDEDHGPVPSIVRAVLGLVPKALESTDAYQSLVSEDRLATASRDQILYWVGTLISAADEQSQSIF